MRISCLECVCKHIGQAAVLLHETVKHYEFHLIYVIGHLAEAEDEAAVDYPDLKDRIYEIRKAIQRGEIVDLDALVEDIFEMWKDLNA